MCHMPGVAGLFFGALGDASVNVLSIAQGCDERNISAVVQTKDATRALRAVHAAFWLSSLELSIGIVGTGRVGSALLQALLENLDILEQRLGLRVKIRGVANSRKMLLGEDLTGSLREILSYFKENATTSVNAPPHSPTRKPTPTPPSLQPECISTFTSMNQFFYMDEVTTTAPLSTESGRSLSHDRGSRARGMSRSGSLGQFSDVRKSESARSLQELEDALCDCGDDKMDADLDVFLRHVKAGPTPHTGKDFCFEL